MKTLIQISDCHIGETKNNNNLKMVVNLILKQDYDAIIISGDLTISGLVDEYTQLQQILKPLNNIFVIPGNHDNTENMRKTFSKKQLSNFSLGDYNLQLLNSKIEGAEVNGFINIQDIDKNLKNSILVVHHPVVSMISPWNADLVIDNHQEFWDDIKDYTNIRAILWGHIHEEKEFVKNNILLYSCPSSAYTFHKKNNIGFNVYQLDNNINKTTVLI